MTDHPVESLARSVAVQAHSGQGAPTGADCRCGAAWRCPVHNPDFWSAAERRLARREGRPWWKSAVPAPVGDDHQEGQP